MPIYSMKLIEIEHTVELPELQPDGFATVGSPCGILAGNAM
jgi:hypothetical protein